jgi:hypothetical protein
MQKKPITLIGFFFIHIKLFYSRGVSGRFKRVQSISVGHSGNLKTVSIIQDVLLVWHHRLSIQYSSVRRGQILDDAALPSCIYTKLNMRAGCSFRMLYKLDQLRLSSDEEAAYNKLVRLQLDTLGRSTSRCLALQTGNR